MVVILCPFICITWPFIGHMRDKRNSGSVFPFVYSVYYRLLSCWNDWNLVKLLCISVDSIWQKYFKILLVSFEATLDITSCSKQFNQFNTIDFSGYCLWTATTHSCLTLVGVKSNGESFQNYLYSNIWKKNYCLGT